MNTVDTVDTRNKQRAVRLSDDHWFGLQIVANEKLSNRNELVTQAVEQFLANHQDIIDGWHERNDG